jgi:hypothetical protein
VDTRYVVDKDAKPRHGTGPGWAGIGWSEPTFAEYATAYQRAADCLVDAVVAGQQSADTLVYPILYSYRHALELALKDANLKTESAIRSRIEMGRLAGEIALSPGEIEKELVGHGIGDLTFRLRRRLSDLVELEILPLHIMAIGAALHAFDQDAQRLRYPSRNKNRGPSFRAREDFRSINLPQFRIVMRFAIQFLLVELPRHLVSDLDLRAALSRDRDERFAQSEREEVANDWDSGLSGLDRPVGSLRPWDADADDEEETRLFAWEMQVLTDPESESDDD